MAYGVKLALAKDFTFKTLDRYVRVELKVVSYIRKNILLPGGKGKMEKKNRQK